MMDSDSRRIGRKADINDLSEILNWKLVLGATESKADSRSVEVLSAVEVHC